MDTKKLNDEEYEKIVQAQIEANKRIKQEEAKSSVISTLIAVIIFIILFIVIKNYLDTTNPSFTLDELLHWFGFSYS